MYGKHLMRFQSETSVSKFLQRGVHDVSEGRNCPLVTCLYGVDNSLCGQYTPWTVRSM